MSEKEEHDTTILSQVEEETFCDYTKYFKNLERF